MIPSRNVHGVNFARQLAEHRLESQPPPTKRFKSSAAPKGSKFAAGYQDRTRLRQQQAKEDGDEGGREDAEDIAQRVKALEDMVKLRQIDQDTFEKLRKEIGVGGDLSSTHLVKGLDWDLLRRVRAGEDVAKVPEKEPSADGGAEVIENVDDELDRLLEEKEDLPAAPKEKKVKKGNMAPPAPPSGGKRTRDEILRQLKASRAAASAATESPPESALGTKFKKINDGKEEKKRWIEQDASGRRKEILMTTDADGKTKRKVRWIDKEVPKPVTDENGLLLPDKRVRPLGMEVPAEIAAKIAAEAAESEDDDIFAGVAADYNPLGDLEEADSSDEETEEGGPVETQPAATVEKEEPKPELSHRRNYFSTTGKAEVPEENRSNPLTSDPTILAAFKRAAALRQASPKDDLEGDEDLDPDQLARRKKFLEEARRREAQDALDIDYGFGSSRIEDEEDEEGIPLESQTRAGTKRRRGPKKRKGDKDSAADVLRVLDGRKKE